MQKEVLQNKAVYFMRTNTRGIGADFLDTDIAMGEIPVGALNAFRALLADLYVPLLKDEEYSGHSISLPTQEILKVMLQHSKQ